MLSSELPRTARPALHRADGSVVRTESALAPRLAAFVSNFEAMVVDSVANTASRSKVFASLDQHLSYAQASEVLTPANAEPVREELRTRFLQQATAHSRDASRQFTRAKQQTTVAAASVLAGGYSGYTAYVSGLNTAAARSAGVDFADLRGAGHPLHSAIVETGATAALAASALASTAKALSSVYSGHVARSQATTFTQLASRIVATPTVGSSLPRLDIGTGIEAGVVRRAALAKHPRKSWFGAAKPKAEPVIAERGETAGPADVEHSAAPTAARPDEARASARTARASVSAARTVTRAADGADANHSADIVSETAEGLRRLRESQA